MEDLMRRWGCAPDGPLIEGAGSRLRFVIVQGAPAVLKLPTPGGGEELAAEVLAAWGGRGATELLAREGIAHLVARVVPGTALAEARTSLGDVEALRILATAGGVLFETRARLDAAPDAWVWGASLLEGSRPLGIPERLWRRARAVFRGLASTQGPVSLLHGDLHHENLLWDERRGWLAIDPKGVVAEREFELGCALRNPVEAATMQQDVIEARLMLLSAEFGLDRGRLAGWAFSQAVLAGAWAAEDGEDPAVWLNAAAAYEARLTPRKPG